MVLGDVPGNSCHPHPKSMFELPVQSPFCRPDVGSGQGNLPLELGRHPLLQATGPTEHPKSLWLPVEGGNSQSKLPGEFSGSWMFAIV